MASNRRSREARLLEPLLARRPSELPDNALGPTIEDLYQVIAAHKASHDHDWIYFTKDEIINMWLGAYNPNIVIPAIPGDGILFDGNIVKIDTARDYSWLGSHTFAALINGTISDAANADKLDTYHASDFWRKAETVSYATSAGNADTLDGYHAGSMYRTGYPEFVFAYSIAVAQAARNVGNYTFTPPSGATAVFVRMAAKWSAASDNNLLAGRDGSSNVTAVVRAFIANMFVDNVGIIPVVGGVCNYSVNGANALSTTISILGYWR